MTEITANIVHPKAIKPGAFIAALVLGPVLFTAPFFATAWLIEALRLDHGGVMILAVIPVAAFVLGAIPYLVFGTPAFVYAVRHRVSTAGAAFLANLLASPLIFAAIALSGSADAAGSFVGLSVCFGSVFAPIWGAVFGFLYRRFAKEPAHV